MLDSFKNFLSLKEIKKEDRIFLMGTFFLPSAFPVGAFLLLISLIMSINKKSNMLDDKWNYPVIISIGLILISTLNITFLNYPYELLDYPKSNIWVNLFNWIPSLVCFWGFQNFLNTETQRLNFFKYFLLGTFPILFSCVNQFVFKIYGPFSTLNGLIVWYQRHPLNGSITGLFNNANYLAFWLSIVLPVALFFFKISKHKSEKISFSLISFLIISFIVLTNSRNGLLCLVIILFSFFALKNLLLYFLSGLFFISITQYGFQLINPSISLNNWFQINIILNNISNFSLDFDSSPRYLIFKSSLSLIREKPLFGWGASTFPYLHSNSGSTVDAQHAHNIFLELAHNFGIPLSLVILITIVILLFKLFKAIQLNRSVYKINLLEKSWLVSTSLIFILHATDITLYDGKINLLICIFLAGCRSILNTHKYSSS